MGEPARQTDRMTAAATDASCPTTPGATCDLPDPAATEAVARRLASRLRAGDVLLLEGPLGAGKTALARGVIGALRDAVGLPAEEVPSPTFTLVQTYDTGAFETWHADLYRLTDPAELAEIGLEEAFRDALCLIEWPDRLGAEAPPDAARITLSPLAGSDGRRIALTAPHALLRRLAPAFEGRP